MSVTEKAERLRAEGKVRPVWSRSYVVEGDTGTYLATIVVADDVEIASHCTCRYDGPCSHLLAAAQTLALSDPEPGSPFDRGEGGGPAARIVR